MGPRRTALLTGLVMLATAPMRADAPAKPDAVAAAAPRIVVEPASFDFGTVKAGRVVQKEFVVRNHGRSELLIDSLVSSCGCTAALTGSKTVKPGGSTPLRITLTAPGEQGRLVKSVLVKSNDPARRTLEVKIEAQVSVAKHPTGRDGN